jgi:hypothetical protein
VLEVRAKGRQFVVVFEIIHLNFININDEKGSNISSSLVFYFSIDHFISFWTISARLTPVSAPDVINEKEVAHFGSLAAYRSREVIVLAGI